ncbi:MAG: Hsp20/alpha crystallin family protein [Candidatus Diapherotrites archaeon]|nr:Hsp20/alpha crystallin family protein [Candidatus Diapherotrites archaeon]
MRRRFGFLDPFEEMRRMLSSFYEFDDELPVESRMRHPAADLWESDDAYHLSIDMPGVQKQDININIVDNGLEITAKKREKHEEKTRNFYRMERNYSGFYRFVALPENAELEKADAKYENGVLEIKVPKSKEKAIGKKLIEIK